MERVILVSPKFGISQIAGLRNSVVSVIMLHSIHSIHLSCILIVFFSL